jgi:hypothetical protein
LTSKHIIILEIFVFMNNAATSQIYKIHVNTEYEPPFRGAGGQKRQEVGARG